MASRARTPTLWELGDHPGRLVVRFCAILLTAAAVLDLLVEGRLGVAFDVVFVALCIAAPLWVRPRDFFAIGILPPLLLTLTVVALGALHRSAVAEPHDSFGQSVISGVAHHGVALAVGYGLTLLLIGLRQVALRNEGIIRFRAIRAAVTDDPPVDQVEPFEPFDEAPVEAPAEPFDEPAGPQAATMPAQRRRVAGDFQRTPPLP